MRGRQLAMICAAAVLLLIAHGTHAAEGAPRTKLVFWNLFNEGLSHTAVTEIVRRFNASSREFYVEKVDLTWLSLHQKMLAAMTQPRLGRPLIRTERSSR